MISAEPLVASIRCIQRIGLFDTFRAACIRSRIPMLHKLTGPEAAFRITRLDRRTVRLRAGTTDWTTFNQIFVKREYDLEKFHQWSSIFDIYRKVIAAGRVPTIIDCGANIGLAAIWFALLFPEARVIAIEMEPGNFAQLKKNVSAFPSITAINAAVWGEVTALTMETINVEAHAYSARRSLEGGIDHMKSVTIDNVINDNDLDSVLCVKLDVEGGEVSILNQKANWIDMIKVLVVEIHDWKQPQLGAGKALVNALHGRDFDLLVSGELLVAVINSARN
jgi:FkbM family methyltransferase